MTRFSLGGDENEEGSSTPRPKRRRLVVLPTPAPSSSSSSSSESGDESSSDDDSDSEADQQQQQLQRRPNNNKKLLSGSASAAPQQIAVASTSTTREKPISITLADPDVLDCPICFEYLSVPVFQCENGHIACSSCSMKVQNKCPSCTRPIGFNRCRAIEKVLEAIRVSCQHVKYGCKEWLTSSNKTQHEKACVHAPCSCIYPGCKFVASTKQLYQHFSCNHLDYATIFQYNCTFSIILHSDEKSFFLQEENDGTLFVIDNQSEIIGNIMSLRSIQPRFMGGFFYDLSAKRKGCLLRLQSFTTSIPNNVDSPASSGCLIIPSDFFSCGEFKLDICIMRNGQCPQSFQSISLNELSVNSALCWKSDFFYLNAKFDIFSMECYK